MPRRVGAYAKLLATYAHDDAIIAAGEAAELLFVRGLAFCATSDSDGYITDGQLTRVVGSGMRDAPRRAASLVREGLWERTEDGYQVRSWLKIHEATEEKGRKLRTDRARKQRERKPDVHEESERSPSGQESGSDGIPTDVTLDSLDCSYVSSTGGTEQSNPIQSSAAKPRTELALLDDLPTAQTIVAEWIERTPKRPPAQVIGQASKLIDNMLAEGIDPDDVRRGVAAWMTKGLHPATLPSVVNEVMNARPRRGTTDQRVIDHLELARRLEKEAAL